MANCDDQPRPSTAQATAGGGAARDLLVVLLIGLPLLSGLGWWLWGLREDENPSSRTIVTTSGVRGSLVGDHACSGCHPGEAALHARSGHAHTFKLAAQSAVAASLDDQSFPDPEFPEVRWTYHLRGDRFEVERTAGASVESLLIEYAFGSDTHATTFVSLRMGEAEPAHAFEHRLTHFRSQGGMGVTPGQEASSPLPGCVAQGRHIGAPETVRCFGCHTTMTSAESVNRVDPESIIPNVNCEQCHGPGREHVEAAQRGTLSSSRPMDFGPGRYKADAQMRLCGQCHRHPEMAPPNAIRPDNVEIVRFQPVGLMQSRCYTASVGTLHCATCHDPHARAGSDRLTYEQTCLQCHQGPDKTPCPVDPRQGCVGCHMPKADPGQGVLFTDHWIRPRGEGR